jgi:hypothetical protein
VNFRDPNSEAAIANRHQLNVDGVICDDHNPVQLNSGPNIVLAKKRSSRPMRFFERLLILSVFSLTLGVFCSEVPEFVSLYDDPSDDFVASSSFPEIGSTQAVRDISKPLWDSAGSDTLSDLPALRSAVPSSPVGPDLLRLLSIQRK